MWVIDCEDMPTCPLTCADIAAGMESCVEVDCEPHCMCEEGTVENEDGECVQVEECGCVVDGTTYPPNFRNETECSVW